MYVNLVPQINGHIFVHFCNNYYRTSLIIDVRRFLNIHWPLNLIVWNLYDDIRLTVFKLYITSKCIIIYILFIYSVNYFNNAITIKYVHIILTHTFPSTNNSDRAPKLIFYFIFKNHRESRSHHFRRWNLRKSQYRIVP